MRRFAVVGAGISGLAAAWELSGHGHVTVYDPQPPGGKLQTGIFEGRSVDLGPDAFVTRVPDAVDLCAELGLGDELVAPSTGAAMLWTDTGLTPMPEGLVLGAPRDLRGVRRSSVLSRLGVARAALDRVLPARSGDGDLSVYDLVAGRFGAQVASRLVDPLVGGIHAGRTEELSAQATTPQLWAAAGRSRSMMRALRDVPAAGSGPVFLTPRDGTGRLVARLVERLEERGVTFRQSAIRTVAVVDGRRVAVDPEVAPYDGVVLAVAASGAAAILGEVAPGGLGGIATASVALVLVSYDATELAPPPGVSGFLVPRTTGRLMTACSFASTKWPHWANPGTTLLRISAGRSGDRRAETMGDNELVDRLTQEINEALGTPATARSVRVTRWPDSFPQYRVGHLDLVAGIEAGLKALGAPVTVAGASYHGAGIPACIGNGRRAAAEVAERVASGAGVRTVG
ncbi:MAG: FAD-dependent oxidoreductase [Actinomycetota bacterium]|nr:FAD-dependent oxidoreductase [Actinomycetota bacterium]